MKCIITNQDTNMSTKGYPLSREGRELLPKIKEAHQAKITSEFEKAFKDKYNDIEIDLPMVNKLSPKLSNRDILRLINDNNQDIRTTINDIIGS